MPYTTLGKNLMLDALGGTNPTIPITHTGLLTKGANITGVTAATNGNFTKTAHGLSVGDLVVLSAMTGGDIVAGHPYFIKTTADANTFTLARTPAGTLVTLTPLISAATVNKLTEISGGSPAYARKSIAFSAAAEGTKDDSTNGASAHDVPAAAVIDYVGFYSASTAGSLLAIDDVTQETFGAQGTYTVTDADIDLLNSLTA